MKQEYIRQVKKELQVPQKVKKEILRDLYEIFASAQEHGETPREVIHRLGSPKIFAKNAQEPFQDILKRQKRVLIFMTACFLFGAVVSIGLFFLTRLHRTPENVIGQSDSMTGILVSSSLPLDLLWLFGIAGCIFLILTVLLVIRLIRK